MNENLQSLVSLLHDELGWPIDSERIQRSAWKLDAAEMGLNDKVDVDVGVHELRPLVPNQPWGVFFMSVEGKSRLSVTLLRRLLRGLVKKKRATAEAASKKLWETEDLMFVCSLDEPGNSTRYFAHFRESEKGLPKLMIGARWEDAQDPNEVKRELQKLRGHLHWPDCPTNIEAWRKQWGDGFQVEHRGVIKTSVALSRALARFAVVIKQNIPEIHRIEREDGPIHRLHEAFREALIKDLKLSDFADMVAQTITYGLFSARATGSELSGIETLSECIPSTNPFLRDLFSEFASLAGNGPTDLDFDDLSLDELVEMLNVCNIDAIMGEFGSQFKGGKEDPVIHFYETFLSEYDHKRRAERGVFYTPKSVVDFIVRSVHDRLIEDFDLPLGLADTSTHIVNGKEWPKVMILDPATGTGTFLEATIDIIHETMLHHWKGQGKSKSEISALWNEYVDEHLLPRLYGFELMMAPYSIAHLKLGMKLIQTGYNSDSENRLNVYLTNTLVEPAPLSSWIPDFISIESENANTAKQDIPFSVVIGNPPYLAASANENPWIRNLMRTKLSDGADSYFRVDGADLGERNPRWINDDYVKFMRYSQFLLARSGFGVFGFITNHGYLNNPTFRGVRQSWMHSFQRIALYDLHGNSKKKEKNPDGGVDENVFDIQQGVAINISTMKNGIQPNISHSDVWGSGDEKMMILGKDSGIPHEDINPKSPFYLFTPSNISEDYDEYLSLLRLMPIRNVGVVTSRDSLVIHFEPSAVMSTLKSFLHMEDEKARKHFAIRPDTRDWKIKYAKEDLRRTECDEKYVIPIQYRPFDVRYTYYTGKGKGIHSNPAHKVMKHMLEGKNLALISARSNKSQYMDHFFVTREISEAKCGESSTQSSHFPLFDSDTGRAVIPKSIVDMISEIIENADALDIFHYAYGIFHSNTYRTRYREMMVIDYPKIPITTKPELFWSLSQFGADLVALHLLEDDYEFASWVRNELKSPFNILSCKYKDGTNQRIVGSMSKAKSFEDGNVFTDTSSINDCSKFTNVPENVWNFTIGGYQVCHKWLSFRKRSGDRDGEVLTDEDILHYRRMIKSIECTLELMEHIDEAIEEHGGWPLQGSETFELPPDRDPDQMGLGDF